MVINYCQLLLGVIMAKKLSKKKKRKEFFLLEIKLELFTDEM